MNKKMIGPAFLVSIAGAIGFVIVFVKGGNTQLEGISLFVAFAGIGTALILWAKHYFPTEEVVQKRESHQDVAAQQEAADLINEGCKDVTRRSFLSKLGLGAIGAVGIASVFPLRSLGPGPNSSLFHTQWEKGLRLTREDGSFVRPDTLDEGGIITVWPDGKKKKEESATLLIKVPMSEFVPRKGREDWVVDGNVAYSKICTHVGCPVGLYQESSRELLCPCHQSTFNVLDGARAVFGPATRSLPQLPLGVDGEGYLIARSDYLEPTGVAFWNRGRGPKKVIE